jgi:hypothetical protein
MRSSKVLSFKLWPVVFVPSLVSLGLILHFSVLILHFSVEVPFWDEWDIPGHFYERFLDGTVGFRTFLLQHNEGRLVFPKLIFAAIGLTVGWKVRIFMLLSWFCLLLTFVLLLRFLLADNSKLKPFTFLCSALPLGLLLFSPAQSITQLWGSTLCMFMAPLCLVGCLWLQSTQVHYGLKVIWCATLSFISTFSFPVGMLCWFLGFPFFTIWIQGLKKMTHREKTRIAWWTGLYLMLALVTIGFYFWDYQKPAWHPSFGAVLRHPLLGLGFFLTWLGGPFTPGTKVSLPFAVACGIFISLGFLLLPLAVLKRQPRGDNFFVKSLHPWICLGAYGTIAGLATAAGRVPLGLEKALAWRYSTISLWVAIGLAGISCTIWHSLSNRPRDATKITSGIIIGILTCLAALSWYFGVHKMAHVNLKMRQNLLTIRLMDVLPYNPLFDRVHPLPNKVRLRARLFLQHGILDYDPVGDWIKGKIEAPDGDKAGWFQAERTEAESIRVEGWARLPNQGIPPDCVVLVRTNPSGSAEIITGLIMRVKRPDVVKALNNPRLLLSGFDDTLSIEVTEGEQLSMFAVDLDNQKAYRLSEIPSRSLFQSDKGHRRRLPILENGTVDCDSLGTWIRSKVEAPDGGDGGCFKLERIGQEGLRVEGWARLPNKERPPDCVILCRQGTMGKKEIIAGFILKVERPDVVEEKNNPRLRLSGFDEFLRLAVREEEEFSMFALNLRKQEAYRLFEAK